MMATATQAKPNGATPAATTVPDTLAGALAALQADMPKLTKGETAKVKSERTGAEYTYTYADLAACAEVIYPKLGALGLSFSAKPTLYPFQAGEGQPPRWEFVLHYVLRHVAGETDEGFYPLADPTRGKPQDMGSAITYARRYTLCSVTGLAPADDDDDAAAAQQAATRNQQREQQAAARQRQQNGNGQQRQTPPPPPAEQAPPPGDDPWQMPASASAAEYETAMSNASTQRQLADIGARIAADLNLDATVKAQLQPAFTKRMQELAPRDPQ